MTDSRHHEATDFDAMDEQAVRLLVELDEALRTGAEISESITASGINTSSLSAESLTSAVLGLMALESVYPRAGRHGTSRVEPAAHPELIGRFQITGLLGSGGFGVVYRGLDPKLNRPVAIKVPRYSLALPELRMRLMREAHAAAKLDHPHIVPIYEAGELEAQPYIAYAYCDGPTLARWCSNQPELMPPRRAARLMLSLTEAIAYSHSRGILHRDIKPSNILLFPQANPDGDSFPFVAKLSDLGLAKFVESNLEETASAMMLGTPSFMSPEQAHGGTVGPTADVYSLGATLYFLLTGRPPFVATRLSELLKQLAEDDPLEPTTLNPNVDAELNTICMKCLDKQSARRYPTAQELADDLQRFLSGVPIRARPASAAYRVQRWCQRKPAIAMLASSVCMLTLGLLATLLVYNYRLSSLSLRLEERNETLSGTVARLDASLSFAEQQRQAAEASAKETRQLLYVDDVQAAGEAWNKRDYRSASKLLARHTYETSMQEFARRYLSTRLATSHADSLPLGAQIWNASISHGGQILAAGDARGAIHLVDISEPLTLKLSWDSGQREINAIAFSPDDKLLASAGDDGRVGLWDATNGQHLRWLDAYQDKPVFGVEFSSDGRRLVACGNTPELLVWNCQDYELIERKGTDHIQGIEALSLSPDGASVATVGHDGYLRIHKVDGMELQTECKLGNKVTVVRYEPTGRYVLTGDRDGGVSLWQVSSGERIASYRAADAILAVTLHKTGRVLATDAGGIVHSLTLESDKATQPMGYSALSLNRVFVSGDVRQAAVCLCPDGKSVITGGASGALIRWSLNSAESEATLPACSDDHVVTFAFTPADSALWRIVDARLDQLDIRQGRLVHSWPQAIPLSCATATRDGKQLCLADRQGRIALLDRSVLGSQINSPMKWHQLYSGSKADQLYVLKDGRRVIAANSNGDIRILDIANQRTIASFDNRSSFGVSPDEQWLACGKSGTNELEIIDMKSWQSIASLPAHASSIWVATFSHDGQWLLTASGDRTAKIWSVGEWTLRYSLDGHADAVRHGTISPDNQTIVTADDSGKIVCWHAATGQKLLEFQQSIKHVSQLAFTPDGRRLIVCQSQGAVSVWHAQ